MARPLYICHYDLPPEAATPLNCGHLTLAIAEQYRAARDPYNPAGDLYVDGDPPVEEDSDDDFADADLHNVEHWAAVARLQWAMTADRPINARAATALIADLQADGELDGIRHATRALIAALTDAYPPLAHVDRPTLVQLVALGADMAKSVGESPDLLEFVKKELQPVNLAALLGV